jgi:phage shock protein A
MGIFNRFVNVLRANTNAALDKAEDPELMLTQMVSDLETQKREAKQRMTEALALQKRFERQTEQEEAEAQKWEDKAVLAVQKGKDDLAKDALVRKKDHARRAKEFRQQLASHASNSDLLRDGYQQLEDKIEEIKRKKSLLVAKQKQAEAQEQIYQTIEGLGENVGAMEAIDRAEEKIEQMSARAEAYQELSLEDGRESLDKKFKELEHESPDMDDELLALKQRALPDAQKKLPEITAAPEASAKKEAKPIAPPVSSIGMFDKMK